MPNLETLVGNARMSVESLDSIDFSHMQNFGAIVYGLVSRSNVFFTRKGTLTLWRKTESGVSPLGLFLYERHGMFAGREFAVLALPGTKITFEREKNAGEWKTGGRVVARSQAPFSARVFAAGTMTLSLEGGPTLGTRLRSIGPQSVRRADFMGEIAVENGGKLPFVIAPRTASKAPAAGSIVSAIKSGNPFALVPSAEESPILPEETVRWPAENHTAETGLLLLAFAVHVRSLYAVL